MLMFFVFRCGGEYLVTSGQPAELSVGENYRILYTEYNCGRQMSAQLATLVERAGGKNGGIVRPKGPAGSMILFHSCLVHASSSDLSPWNRVSVYLSLCAVSNHIRRFKRPEYIAHRDFALIECLPDDCLLGFAMAGWGARQRAADEQRAVR
jgi:ectoine hydroxylase